MLQFHLITENKYKIGDVESSTIPGEMKRVYLKPLLIYHTKNFYYRI